MIKNILLKSGLAFISLLLSITQLNAEAITYYFTEAVEGTKAYTMVANWNSERDGSGTNISTADSIQNAEGVTLVIPTGKTAKYNSSITIKGHLVIEDGGTVTISSSTYLYGRITVESGGIMNCGNILRLYDNAKVEIAGTISISAERNIEGATATTSNTTIEVKPGGLLTGTGTYWTGYITNNIKLIINGTVIVSEIRAVHSIEGNGALTVANKITGPVSDIAGSSFLQTGGGSVINTNTTNGNAALFSSYNHLEINSIPSNNSRQYTGASTVYGNLGISGNAGLLTLAGTIDVKGNLTVADSKVVTGEVIQVAGDVATSGLVEGSILNVTLTGTAQNIQGAGITNLVVPAGTTATLTGDLTVTNLVNSGTIDENGYTLTVINLVANLITDLQNLIDNVANNYTEADYTAESWATLQEAIAAAQPLLEAGADPTSTQLDNAIAAVTEAIGALVTNLSVLESWISTAKDSYDNPTVYTAETYDALHTAIALVEAFLEGKTALTSAELEAQTAAVNTAIAALVRMTYTFYLVSGGTSLVYPLSYDKWNTERDGTGIQAVPFAPENTGHTYIIPDFVVTGAYSTTFYGSHVILEEGTTSIGAVIELSGGSLTVENGRTYGTNLRTYIGDEVIRVKQGGAITGNFTGQGGEVTVEAGGAITTSAFNGNFKVEANGTASLSASSFTTLTGTGTVTTAANISLSDAAQSTFLQAGGGTIVYRGEASLLPSYNHLTIENQTATRTFGLEVEGGAHPTVTVYGNLLLNSIRRTTISNPLDVRGDFTFTNDDDFPIVATLSVSGNVILSGLPAEDNTLNVTLSGTSQTLSGAGLTNLTVPATTTATLTGDLSVENDLVLNGVLDLNGHRLSSGYTRTGEGVLTDSQLAARLQTAIDDAQADYPNSSLYTAASWEPFADAVEQGLALLSGDAPAEATALQSALDDLAAAVAGLELLTGIDRITAEDIRIDVQSPGSLRIAGTADVKVFTLTGIQLFGGRVNGEKTLSLSSGVYVVSINGKAAKVVVK
jgi:cytoskeletal protein CcmA (bactofilin family)